MEQIVNFYKTDFNESLDQISKQEFEKAFFASLYAHTDCINANVTIYVYLIGSRKLRVTSTEIQSDKTNLICKEKLSVFYATSQEARAAFYDARILKHIRDRYNTKCKKA